MAMTVIPADHSAASVDFFFNGSDLKLTIIESLAKKIAIKILFGATSEIGKSSSSIHSKVKFPFINSPQFSDRFLHAANIFKFFILNDLEDYLSYSLPALLELDNELHLEEIRSSIMFLLRSGGGSVEGGVMDLFRSELFQNTLFSSFSEYVTNISSSPFLLHGNIFDLYLNSLISPPIMDKLWTIYKGPEWKASRESSETCALYGDFFVHFIKELRQILNFRHSCEELLEEKGGDWLLQEIAKMFPDFSTLQVKDKKKKLPQIVLWEKMIEKFAQYYRENKVKNGQIDWLIAYIIRSPEVFLCRNGVHERCLAHKNATSFVDAIGCILVMLEANLLENLRPEKTIEEYQTEHFSDPDAVKLSIKRKNHEVCAKLIGVRKEIRKMQDREIRSPETLFANIDGFRCIIPIIHEMLEINKKGKIPFVDSYCKDVDFFISLCVDLVMETVVIKDPRVRGCFSPVFYQENGEDIFMVEVLQIFKPRSLCRAKKSPVLEGGDISPPPSLVAEDNREKKGVLTICYKEKVTLSRLPVLDFPQVDESTLFLGQIYQCLSQLRDQNGMEEAYLHCLFAVHDLIELGKRVDKRERTFFPVLVRQILLNGFLAIEQMLTLHYGSVDRKNLPHNLKKLRERSPLSFDKQTDRFFEENEAGTLMIRYPKTYCKKGAIGSFLVKGPVKLSHILEFMQIVVGVVINHRDQEIRDRTKKTLGAIKENLAALLGDSQVNIFYSIDNLNGLYKTYFEKTVAFREYKEVVGDRVLSNKIEELLFELKFLQSGENCKEGLDPLTRFQTIFHITKVYEAALHFLLFLNNPEVIKKTVFKEKRHDLLHLYDLLLKKEAFLDSKVIEALTLLNIGGAHYFFHRPAGKLESEKSWNDFQKCIFHKKGDVLGDLKGGFVLSDTPKESPDFAPYEEAYQILLEGFGPLLDYMQKSVMPHK